MRGAILTYALVAMALLALLDRVWPIWLVHALIVIAFVVVLAMTVFAWVASGRRR